MNENSKQYTSYASILHDLFPVRVQKISVNAGFTCPNRDGSKGVGGCTYCNNQSFTPEYCQSQKSVNQQVVEGIAFFKAKYPTQQYLAYFQSYTNTYANFEKLQAIYDEALSVEGVVGLIIGTRPDCVSDELLDYLSFLAKSKYVMIEFGVESVYDETLTAINRGHNFADTQNAIQRTSEKGIYVGAHLILGLPNESRDMILATADRINELPINALKLHQLQLIKGTKMAEQYEANSAGFQFFELEAYVELLIDFIECLNPKIAIERFISQSPKNLVLMPQWSLKNFEFVDKLDKRLKERDTWQGKFFSEN